MMGGHPLVVEDDEFSRLDGPDKFGTYQIKRTALRGDHPGVFPFAETQGAEPIGVPHGDQVMIAQQHQGIRPSHQEQRLNQSFEQRVPFGMGHQMNDDFRVGIGLKDRAVCLKFTPKD